MCGTNSTHYKVHIEDNPWSRTVASLPKLEIVLNSSLLLYEFPKSSGLMKQAFNCNSPSVLDIALKGYHKLKEEMKMRPSIAAEKLSHDMFQQDPNPRCFKDH
jgi:hypothetical protein